MKKIFNIFRRSVLSPSSSSSSPPRRDSGVPPFGPDSYIIRVKDLGKIHKAAALGDVKKVQELLLHEKAGVDDLDKKHRTPLHLACANGYPDVVSLLVERKCELNPLDDEDQTPLMNAVQYQQEECTTILLEHGADSCAMNTYQSTALHYAACLHNIKIASKLLRYNVPMEAKNKDGCTPLLLAVMKNNPDMVDLFLKNGANVNTSDVRDRTPLMIAARSNRLHVVSLLLQYDIDFSHKDAYGRTAVDYAFYGSPLMHRLVVDEYKKQKALNQPLSPQICGSERASHTEFTLGGSDNDQEDSIEELDLGAEDVIDVTKNQPGSKVFETFPFEEDEAFGFGSDSETGFSIVIPGEKPVPRKQFEVQIPIVKEQDEEGPSDWNSSSASLKTESARKSKNFNIYGNHPWQSVSVTRIPCGPTPKIRKISTLEDEAVGAGSGTETEFEDAIRGQKSVPQKQAEPQFPVKPLKGPSDWDSSSASLKTESSGKSKDSKCGQNHPWQSVSVTRIPCGRTPKTRKISTLEDEAVGAGRGPETESEDAIRGQKSVPQKQAEPQIPVKPLKDSLQRYLNLKPIPATTKISYSFSNQDLGKGIQEKQKSYSIKELGFNETDETNGPSDRDSCSTSLKTESYRKCRDLNLDENHPCQLLPETKIRCGSTLFGNIPFQEDETVGAGNDSETELRLVVRGEKSVAQKEDEPHLSVKKLKVNEGPSDWDSCSTSLKTESYRKSTDLNFDENHPCQSLPATKIHSGSPVLGKITFKEEQALGAGSRPETEFRVVIRGEKSVTQKREEKEGNDEACRGSSEECPESLDKSDLEEDKAQMESNDRDDQIQASGTATEDYDLLPLNYPMRHLRTEIVVLRYDRTVERKKTHCTLLTRKVKSLQNKINGLREKLSEARQMKSHLEHQKAEWNRELLRIRCTLKQEEMEQVTTEMLFEESRQLFRRKKERYSKAVALNQQLECTFRSQEAELRTIRNHLQQVEEELNDTQRQLVQVQRARALQDTILKNLLWKQKEKEAVASKATQTSEVPENNEKEKTLLDKNQILLDEVFVLKLDLHRVKMELQQKENQFTEDTDVLKETIDELHKKLQLKEEALTKITSQYRGQLNVLTTENEVLNSKLEKAKRSRDRLETEIASYHARLTSALHDHERSQISNPDLEQTVQRERDELRRLHDELIHHLGSLSETNGVLSQRLWKAEGKTNSLQRELNCVRDSLREKTLTLETTQRELNRAQHKANELQHLNQVEKEKMDKCIFQHESVQKRLTQIESENMLLQQQLEDAQNKNIVKEKVLSDSHGQFMDRFHCVRADTGKQALMREDRNGELTGEYNYLREKIPKYEKEKAKIKTTVRRQQELADFLIEQSVTETSLEVKSFARNDFEVKKKLPKERDEAKSKLCTERDNLKKRSELNQSLVNCLERELKRNEELQKELRGYKSLYITTNNKLREYEAIFSSLSSSSTLSSSSSSSPSSSSSSSS